MMAIDLGKLRTSGEKNPHDPSMPPFWLPFQDISGGNHIAQWTTKVARVPCTSDLQCAANEKCADAHCYPR